MGIFRKFSTTYILSSILNHIDELQVRQPDTFYYVITIDNKTVWYKLKAYDRFEVEQILDKYGAFKTIQNTVNMFDYIMVRFYHIDSKTGKILYNDKFEVDEIHAPEGSLLFTLQDL